MYEKPKFHIARHGLDAGDWGGALGAFFLQVASLVIAVLLTSPEADPLSLLPTLLMAGCGGATLYSAVKRLVGSRAAALTSAVILAGGWTYAPQFFLISVAVVLVGILFLSRSEENTGGGFALLWGILCALCLFLYAQMLPLVLWAGAVLLLDGIVRGKKGQFWVLPLNILCFCFAGFLCLSCLVAGAYLPQGIAVMDALKQGGFLASILLCFRGFTLLALPSAFLWGELSFYAPATALSLGGCVFLAYSALLRREGEVLAVAAAVLILTVLAIFFTPQCLVLAGAISLGYMTGRLFHRDALAQGAVGAAFWTAATLAISLTTYF
jgi:hypothetical protein